MSDAPEDLPHTLMPLVLAAELIYSKVYDGQTALPRLEVLNSIASTLAALAPIYEYSVDPDQPPRWLSRTDLEGGMFKGGALRLQFIDGRQPRASLAVAADDVAQTIDTLKKAQG